MTNSPNINRKIQLGVNPKITTIRDILSHERLHLIMPQTGLADRLFILSSFLALCHFSKRKLQIYWPVNEECNGKLSDLYDLDFACTEFDFPYTEERKQLLNIVLNEYTTEKKAPIFYFKCGTPIDKINQLLIGILIPKKISKREFEKTELNLLRELRLRHNAKKNINTFMQKNFSPNIPIGIHMRRTDMVHKRLINLPRHWDIASWQLTKIDRLAFELIAKHAVEGAHFFIACDNAKYQKKIQEFLLERKCTSVMYVKEFSSELRQTPLDAAICDMYLLSKCKKILRCGPSHFSELAAQIGNVPSESIETVSSWHKNTRNLCRSLWHKFHR